MSRPVPSSILSLIAGLSLGIGAVAVASPSGSGAASDAKVVRELRSIGKKLDAANRKLDVANQTLGGSASKAPEPSIQAIMETTCEELRAAARGSATCPTD